MQPVVHPVDKVAILGASNLGVQIACAAAQAGLPVTLYDSQQAALPHAAALFQRNLDLQVNKNLMTSTARQDAVARFKTTHYGDHIADADVVIVTANQPVPMLKNLNRFFKPATPVAFTTSAQLHEQALASGRSAQCAGMFFAPSVLQGSLLEVAALPQTTSETLTLLHQLGQTLGLVTVAIHAMPGSLRERMQLALMQEAMLALQQGTAEIETIDSAARLGLGLAQGPLAMADGIGLDVVLMQLGALHDNGGDPRYLPTLQLQRLVAQGHLGAKTGRGFYVYDGATQRAA